MSSYTKQNIINQYKKGKQQEFVFFWRPYGVGGIYSQWFKSSFTVNGTTYCCAEQFMMAEKARTFDDCDTLAAILDTDDPNRHRILGRQVKNYDEELWGAIRKRVVVEGSLEKFRQSEDLMEMLIRDKDKILVEASPYDKIWGIGMKAGTYGIENPENWTGENNLGFAIMEARDTILKEYAEKNIGNKDLKAMIECCTDFGQADLVIKKYTDFTTDTERTAFLKGLFDVSIIHRSEEDASTDYAAVLTTIIDQKWNQQTSRKRR